MTAGDPPSYTAGSVTLPSAWAPLSRYDSSHIQSSQGISKLASALVKVQAEMKAAGKSGENTYDHYKYAKLEDYLAVARPILAANGLAVLTSVKEVNRLPDRQTSKGGIERAVEVLLIARLVHESGEWIEVEGVGEGQDRADKAPYKALTGGKKYLLAGLLAIPTTDEPEADEQVGQAPPPPKVTRTPPRQDAPTSPAEPAPLTNKQRFEKATLALQTKYGIAQSNAFIDQLKLSHGGSKTVDQKMGVLLGMEAVAFDNKPMPQEGAA